MYLSSTWLSDFSLHSTCRSAYGGPALFNWFCGKDDHRIIVDQRKARRMEAPPRSIVLPPTTSIKYQAKNMTKKRAIFENLTIFLGEIDRKGVTDGEKNGRKMCLGNEDGMELWKG